MGTRTCLVATILTSLLGVNSPVSAEATARSAFKSDAVTTDANGHRVVKFMTEGREHYPTPPFYSKAPLTAPKVGSTYFDAPFTTLFMIEGKRELMECSAPTLDPAVCRASTFGSVKRLRYWIVLQNDQWLICHVAKPINPKAHDGTVCSNDFPKPSPRPAGSVVPEVMMTMGTGIYPE